MKKQKKRTSKKQHSKNKSHSKDKKKRTQSKKVTKKQTKKRSLHKKNQRRKGKKGKKQQIKQMGLVKKMLLAFFFTTVLYLLLFVSLFSVAKMEGYAMVQTLNHHDRLLIARHTEISRFDLVYIKTPGKKNSTSVRRVIGLPGDSLTYTSDELHINGEEISEKFLTKKKKQMGTMVLTDDFTLKEVTGKEVLAKNSYFVMGDNRKSSTDSRYYGTVSEKEIIGKVQVRIFPLSKFRIY